MRILVDGDLCYYASIEAITNKEASMMQFFSSLKERIFQTPTVQMDAEQNSSLLACLANLN